MAKNEILKYKQFTFMGRKYKVFIESLVLSYKARHYSAYFEFQHRSPWRKVIVRFFSMSMSYSAGIQQVKVWKRE